MKKNTSRIRGVPQNGQPYEKCLQNGPEILSDTELLAVILRTGIPGKNTLEVAAQVLSATEQTSYPGLHGLMHLSMKDLTGLDGIGEVKAIQLKCIGELSKRIARESARAVLSFHDAQSIAMYYMEQLRHEEREHLIVMMLDTRNHLMSESRMSSGSVSAAVVSPREIFLEALRMHAVSIILVHNHPSGDPSPSSCDVDMTMKTQEAGQMVGVKLVDHIIIGDRKYYSFREEGFLDNDF